MSQGRKRIEPRSAKIDKRATKERRTGKGNGETPLSGSIMERMEEYKTITVKIAEELGFEHREEPSADEVKGYLLDIPMDPDDYALLHKLGGRLTLCLSILESEGAADRQIREARSLAAFAYDVVGV